MNGCINFMALLELAFSFKYMPEDETSAYFAARSIGPKHVAVAQDIPHHVLIAYGTYYCSGALVRSRIVVTTASCFNRRTKQKIYVKVGGDTITGHGQVIPVEELKIHEYYQRMSALNNDIALLALMNNVEFSTRVKKVILVESEVAIRIGTNIEVSGWGHTDPQSKFINNLVWSEMAVINKDECIKYYKGLITSSSFCAKYQVERRLSDNGGPAVYRGLLVGLLSFGADNSQEPYVAIFTNVSFFHRWITLNSRIFLEKYCNEHTSNQVSGSLEIN